MRRLDQFLVLESSGGAHRAWVSLAQDATRRCVLTIFSQDAVPPMLLTWKTSMRVTFSEESPLSNLRSL